MAAGDLSASALRCTHRRYRPRVDASTHESMLDHGGALLIGVAMLWLFHRVVSALLQRDAIQRAMRQHHPEPATAQPGRLRAATQKVLQYASGLDARLKLAGGIGVATAVIGVAPAVVQSYMGTDSTIGAAFGVTLRWALIAGLVHTLRKAVRGRVGPR
eukprot:scaffold6852_cov84-Phaeocystis_antarctica.AAC.2